MQAPSLEDWITLIRSFIDGSLPPDDFETTYFAYSSQANAAHEGGNAWVIPEDAERILGNFFVEVDCLSNDPTLFPDLHVTADELRKTARGVLAELEQMGSG